MYMAASKRLCIEPTSIILGSALTTLIASRIVGADFSSSDESSSPSLEVSETPLATFSLQRRLARSPPRTRNPTDTSKGPLGPRCAAARPAICPARMATMESPAYASPNVSPRLLSTPSLPASPTSQASGALKRRLVPIPPNTRPSSSTPRRLLLVLIAPRLYSSENARVPALRPYVSQSLPTKGPKTAVEANPVRKRRETHVIADPAAVLNDFDA
mmetsp:Transcript_11042/g.25711  ORF Transcript_11042/g.25711 Transcript_11042/m.25711 type:complete len:216 (-) Transcript_11042:506-1153(-)